MGNADINNWPGKLLLFGEYSVLVGSQALAIPLHMFSGEWRPSDESKHQNPDLRKFATYLAKLGEEFPVFKNVGPLIADIANGYHFKSDIPRGYGVGSSGALCAAIYDRYFYQRGNKRLEQVRSELAAMESFYHGSSSGMDPLVSWSGSAILKVQDSYHAAQLPSSGVPQVILLDSGIPRQTTQLVSQFQEMLHDETYAKRITEIHGLVDLAIPYWVAGQWSLLRKVVRLLCQAQWQLFQPMIPENIRDVWQKIATEESLEIKLCGAGGGGYFLIFDFEGSAKLNKIASEFQLLPVKINSE